MAEEIRIEEVGSEAAAQAIAETGLFKPKTEYLLIGDEVPGSGVFDLKTILSDQDYEQIKKFMVLMPRAILREWFMVNVWPSLPEEYLSEMSSAGGRYFDPVYGTWRRKKRFEDLVWAAFVDLFNQANLVYVNENKIEPWVWEQEKLQSFLIAKDSGAVADIKASFEDITNEALERDPKAKAILEQFATLPKLGDTGLEINRQNALRELLKMKDYESAQAIVNVFRFMNEAGLKDVMSEPIPFDITTEDGQVIKKT